MLSRGFENPLQKTERRSAYWSGEGKQSLFVQNKTHSRSGNIDICISGLAGYLEGVIAVRCRLAGEFVGDKAWNVLVYYEWCSTRELDPHPNAKEQCVIPFLLLSAPKTAVVAAHGASNFSKRRSDTAPRIHNVRGKRTYMRERKVHTSSTEVLQVDGKYIYIYLHIFTSRMCESSKLPSIFASVFFICSQQKASSATGAAREILSHSSKRFPSFLALTASIFFKLSGWIKSWMFVNLHVVLLVQS